MRAENFDIQIIIDCLLGTCKTLQAAIDGYYEGMSEEDLNSEDIERLYGEIFLCYVCGWWCEICDESGIDDSQEICNDCSEDY